MVARPSHLTLPVLCSLFLTGVVIGPADAAGAPPTSGAAQIHSIAPPTKTARPTLRYGSRGSAVRTLQSHLAVRPVSGWFGPITRSAVRRHQAAHGIRPTGVVDPRTWASILGPTRSASRTASRTASAQRGWHCPAPRARRADGWGVQRSGHRHQGIDLHGKRGSAILAVERGRIVRAGRQRNGALRIVLQGASGAKYYYGHNDKNLVRTGQRVKAGQRIALMGDTGARGAVHLHFEWWRTGRESAAVPAEPLIKRLCR